MIPKKALRRSQGSRSGTESHLQARKKDKWTRKPTVQRQGRKANFRGTEATLRKIRRGIGPPVVLSLWVMAPLGGPHIR